MINDPQWQNTTVLSGDPIQQVRALKEQQGQDIVITGSISLCHTLIEAGLVDEYRLFKSIPLCKVVADGCSLDGFELAKLQLLESRTFGDIVYLRYASA